MFDPDYSFLDRLLHRLALDCAPVADVGFDLDQAMVQTDPAEIVHQRHVFVAGLARAGTTVLMRQFHATGQYRSLTYRDMPLVLFPNLWRRLSLISRRDIKSAERVHGDNVLVDGDSPESFDEVFWRIFAGEQYISSSWLAPHAPNTELMKKYVHYVNGILSATDLRLDRYLCKNNNNILRLDAIHQAFPKALILIPFREPRQHAYSLLRQHLHFREMQAQRPFMLTYMTWLGHHEFGLGHRPFRFDDAGRPKHTTNTLNYWLQLWCEAYSWLERSSPKAALFVCYEDLCVRPETWSRLAELADISTVSDCGNQFTLSERLVSNNFDGRLVDYAISIYKGLVARARAQLS